MSTMPMPANETERLRALRELDILDTENNPILDEIAHFARDLFEVDVALVSLVDEHRQWFKSRAGFELCETPRDVSFCSHAVAAARTLIIEDAKLDPRFADNPFVTVDKGVRFYAGAPLVIDGEFVLGTLCLIHPVPRSFSAKHQRWLETLAQWVTDEIITQHNRENYAAERRVLAQGPVVAVEWDVQPEAHLIYVAENAKRVLGYDSDYLLRDDIPYESIVHADDRDELLARMQQVIDGHERVLEMDYRMVDSDGRERWIHHYARSDRSHDGKVMRVRGYLMDDTKGKQLELELLSTNRSFELALAAGNLSTWEWIIATNELRASHSWDSMVGPMSANEVWSDRLYADDIAPLLAAAQQHYRGETERFEARFRLCHNNGHLIWVHSVGKLVERDVHGKPLKMVGIHHDITEQMENEQARAEQQAMLSLVSQVQNEFLLVHDFSDVCDLALPELMNITASEFAFIGEIPQQDRQRNLLLMHGIVNQQATEQQQSAWQNLIKQGLQVELSGEVARDVIVRGEPQICYDSVCSGQLHLTPLQLPKLSNAILIPLYFKGKVVGLLVLANSHRGYQREHFALLQPMMNTLGTLLHIRRVEDERLRALTELHRLATVDDLTGVANRRVFLEACERRFAEWYRYDVPVSVVIIDLDFFKQVNDTYGHAAGDFVLQEFCRICLELLREIDLLGRTGGEEFGVLLPVTDEVNALAALERIRQAVAAKPFHWQGVDIAVTISAGVAQLRDTDTDVARWLARTDEALYRAKNEGRNRCLVAK